MEGSILFVAAEDLQISLVRLLLARGASVNTGVPGGMMPLGRLMLDKEDTWRFEEQRVIIRAIIPLLLQHGAQILEKTDEGEIRISSEDLKEFGFDEDCAPTGGETSNTQH